MAVLAPIVREQNIPLELKAIHQWVCWKPVEAGDKIKKVPVDWRNPLGDGVNAHDPLFWGTFEQCLTVTKGDPRFGVGIVLDGTGIICLDLDRHAGHDAEAAAQGEAMLDDMLSKHPTYSQTSHSGTGRHVFYRATLPHGRLSGKIEHLSLEIFAAQFIAMTGDSAWGTPAIVANGQSIVDEWNIPTPVAGSTSLGPTRDLGRHIGLDDKQVVLTLKMRREATFNMIDSQADLHDRSASYSRIVGDLDKITGDPMQIDRIIRKAPFFKNAYNREKYENEPAWLARQGCNSMLEYWLKQSRRDNTECIAPYEHLTPERIAFLDQVVQNTIAAQKEKRERELAADIEALAQERVVAGRASNLRGGSEVSAMLDKIRSAVPGEYDMLTPPPGVVGAFVDALTPMLGDARLTYMIPAVIATLSGYLGQTYKVPGYEMGFVNHFIIAGQMNTGKTTSMLVLNNAIDAALSGYYRDPDNQTRTLRIPERDFSNYKRRLIKTRASSVQGLFGTVAQIGAGTWFADEAETQIKMMCNNDDKLGVATKAFYKETFDVSGPLLCEKLDASRESQKLGLPDIVNMTLPSYFSCTSEVFQDMGEKEIVDGTFSRAHLIYDEEPMSDDEFDETMLAKGLPLRLTNVMRRIARVADYTSEGYGLATLSAALKAALKGGDLASYYQEFERFKQIGAERCVILSYTQEANDLKRKIQKVCRTLGKEANPAEGKWPAHYQMMARSDILPLLIAGVLATCDMFANWCQVEPVIPFAIKKDTDEVDQPNTDWRENMPPVVVTAVHMQWAFEFTVYWRAQLFDAWDQGKIATSIDDDEKHVIAAIRKKGCATGKWFTERTVHESCKNWFKALAKKTGVRGADGYDLFKKAMAKLAAHGMIERARDTKITGQTHASDCFRVLPGSGISW